jgi:hypothetical protein
VFVSDRSLTSSVFGGNTTSTFARSKTLDTIGPYHTCLTINLIPSLITVQFFHPFLFPDSKSNISIFDFCIFFWFSIVFFHALLFQSVGGDFDDFDESQLLERALDMGLDFETARDMIFSGNIASLLSGKAGLQFFLLSASNQILFAYSPFNLYVLVCFWYFKYLVFVFVLSAPSRSAPSQHRNFEDDISALIEEMHMDDELNANAAPFVMPNVCPFFIHCFLLIFVLLLFVLVFIS